MTLTPDRPNLRNVIEDREQLQDTFRADVLEGLAKEHKSIPAKHLYDAKGSDIFDRICEVKDYYPTRTEQAIADRYAGEIAEALGPGLVLIEPGAGSCGKAERLLPTLRELEAFVPIEISRSALESAAERLADRFPELHIHPICADFTRDVEELEAFTGRHAVYFPGSTIGNLLPEERAALLATFARDAGPGGLLHIGFDLVKDEATMRAAYNDSEGVTAAFNLNLLDRINRELGGDFDASAFEHDAPWNPEKRRIEMHLVSTRDQEVTVDGETFRFGAGERMHTENSHKFTVEGFHEEARGAGFEPVTHWTDENGWFCLALYRVAD